MSDVYIVVIAQLIAQETRRVNETIKAEVEYFPDRRLKLLLRCYVGDKNFWYDERTNSYTICLSQDTIFLLVEAYFAFNAYNIWKRRNQHRNN